MIYELAVVVRPESGDEGVSKVTELVAEVLKSENGEIAVQDSWGTLTFAQATSEGEARGTYAYLIYRADAQTNAEIERRFRINENVLKYLFVKLGEDNELDQLVKSYRTPFSKKYKGSVTDSVEGEGSVFDLDKDRKKFARRKSCWFSATKTQADWKDPASFSWLINEFGKIAPARVSGISRKHQRWATSAIKRARQIGLASYMNGNFAE